MKCPYHRRVETQVQKWNQNPDENQSLTDGKTVTQTVFELMDCEKKTAEHGITENAAIRQSVYQTNNLTRILALRFYLGAFIIPNF